MKKGDYIPLFWQQIMIKIFLQSATDVRTDVCSWFAIDQMYCTVFNLTSLKFHDLTTGLETKWYRRMFLASVLGGESCSKSNWLPNEHQKPNSTTPQPHSYSGPNPQITQPKKPTFLFFLPPQQACLLGSSGYISRISLLPSLMPEK